jgi:hypothetical protein
MTRVEWREVVIAFVGEVGSSCHFFLTAGALFPRFYMHALKTCLSLFDHAVDSVPRDVVKCAYTNEHMHASCVFKLCREANGAHPRYFDGPVVALTLDTHYARTIWHKDQALEEKRCMEEMYASRLRCSK